jgi:HlyD family secretion protein
MPRTAEHQTRIDIREALFQSPAGPQPGGPTSDARPGRRRRWMWAAGAAVLLVAGGVVASRWLLKSPPPAYATATVERGDIARTVSATGRLQALTTVQVGTQASGTVSEIYVDFNSEVTRGQVIARLDPSQFQAQLTQAQANLTGAQANVQSAQAALLSAEAGVESAQANVQRMEAMAADARVNRDRARQMVEAGLAARLDLPAAESAYAQAMAQQRQAVAQLNQARAQAQSSRSQLNQAQAQVSQANAMVQLASVNMGHTVIRAPIDGVIVERNVDVGQTVAASLQAPVLFLIANDLTRMQVLAEIDEADVGQLQPQSRVTFTVDAFPRDTFEGRIQQIRLAPQMLQNVVTYTAVINVDNPELKLKPGMTATVAAVVAEQEDVLKIPAAALRFRPEGAAAESTPRAGTSPAGAAARGPGGGATVYKVKQGQLQPVTIRTGLSDGASVQVVSGELQEGDSVALPTQPGAQSASSPPRGLFGSGRPSGTGRIR